MPPDQRRQTEIAARILRDLDDPMFRLALRVQEEALRAEPQWVSWSRVRRHGDDDVPAYFSSKWHRLASPGGSQPTAGTVHILKTLCGRNVPGDATTNTTSTPFASRDGSIELCRTCVRLQPRRPGLN
jgi:hypothetical protein